MCWVLKRCIAVLLGRSPWPAFWRWLVSSRTLRSVVTRSTDHRSLSTTYTGGNHCIRQFWRFSQCCTVCQSHRRRIYGGSVERVQGPTTLTRNSLTKRWIYLNTSIQLQNYPQVAEHEPKRAPCGYLRGKSRQKAVLVLTAAAQKRFNQSFYEAILFP